MMLALLAAVAIHWVTVPDAKSPKGYVGWKLDQKQIVELDRRLELPEGAWPREEYARYYSGHIAPDGTRRLFITLKHKRIITVHPRAPARKPDHIYIYYRNKGKASIPVGVHMGCLFISGEFDADFKPLGPLACTNEGT